MTKADLEEYDQTGAYSSGDDANRSEEIMDPVPAKKKTFSHFTVQDRHVSTYMQ